VSAFDAVDQRFTEMQRQQSQEKNRKVYSWKCFYTTSSIMCGLLIICAAGIYIYQSRFDGELRAAASNTGKPWSILSYAHRSDLLQWR
jgi:hypothetical protein